MVALLPPGEIQLADANGMPYAGGTITYYIPGTTTPKATWSESTGTALNSNPVVLDSAGRAIVFGDGLYRMVVEDAAGNLIYDQLTSSLVSVAMAPVMLAPDIPTAQGLLGITALSTALTAGLAAANAAIAAEGSTRAAADAAEGANRYAADNAILAALVVETARAEAAEAALAGGGFPAGQRLQFGQGITNSAGAATVAYPISYSATPTVFITETGAASGCIVLTYGVTTNSFIVFSSKSFTTGDGLGPVGFAWLALGPT